MEQTKEQLVIDISWDTEAKSGRMPGVVGKSELPWGKDPDPTFMIKVSRAVVSGPK